MVDYLIEVIFKKVSKSHISDFLLDITANGTLVDNYNLTCDFSPFLWNHDSLDKLFNNETNFGLFINIQTLKSEHITIPNLGIVVLKFDKGIDLEINFDSFSIENTSNLTQRLMQLALEISKKCQPLEYYCGIEPAEDKETRLFTNDEIGPFSLGRGMTKEEM